MSGPARVETNRHPALSGRRWGWVASPVGDVLFWEGEEQRERARARAEELDRIGWDQLTEPERHHV